MKEEKKIPVSKVDDLDLHDTELIKAWKTFYEEFSAESDRAAVVLGTSHLDNMMYRWIKLLLVPSTSKDDDLLDSERAPLGTLSARTLFLYRIGVIDAQFFSALNIVRRIRNDFAHSTSTSSLEMGPNSNRVRELIAMFKDNETFKDMKAKSLEKHKGLSAGFRCALALMSLRFTGAIKNSRQIEPEILCTLLPPTNDDTDKE